MKIRKENQHLLLDADSNGKFKFEFDGTPKFMLESFIHVFEYIITQNEHMGHEFVTGLIGGLLASDKVDIDKIIKELDSIKED